MEYLSLLPAYALFIILLIVLYLWDRDHDDSLQERHAMQTAWAKERKDLYDRIMAASFTEYKDRLPESETPNLAQEETEVVDLDEGHDQMLGIESEETE